MDLVIILISAGLIGLVVWWFFGRRDAQQTAVVKDGRQYATITVDGGYQPAVTVLEAGIPAELAFRRLDSSACLEEVVLPDFGIQKQLVLGRTTIITLPDPESGEFGYSCGMRMYRGQLVVK